MLSRREHTRRELVDKLGQRGFDLKMVHKTVDDLAEQNLQCDARFANLFTEQRINKGFGPMKIRAQLFDRGVSTEIAEQALMDAEVDWIDCAVRVAQKKFKNLDTKKADLSLLNKCRRYLYSRGFSQDQIREVLFNLDQ